MQLQKLAEDYQTFSSGQTIFAEGEPGDCMYGILNGEVEIFIDGKVVESIQKGDVFGIGALIVPEHTRASTAVAKTECELAFLDQNGFLFAVQETPMFALVLNQIDFDRFVLVSWCLCGEKDHLETTKTLSLPSSAAKGH